MQGNEKLACQKAVEAFVVQTGIQDTMQKAEGFVKKESSKQANKIPGAKYLGFAGGMYQMYRTKMFSVKVSKNSALTFTPIALIYSVNF